MKKMGKKGIDGALPSEGALEHELRKKHALLELLQKISIAANEADDVAVALRFALDQICAYTGWPVGHVYRPAADASHELIPTTLWCCHDPDRFGALRQATTATRMKPGVGLPGRVVATGAPAWIVDVTQDDNFPRAQLARDLGVKAAFAFPVWVGTEVVAVMEFFAEAAMELDAPFMDVMASVGTQLGRVAERTRADRQHRSQEERLRTLTDTAVDAIVTADSAGTIQEWNTGAERIFGYTKEDVVGRPLTMLMPRQYHSAHNQGMQRVQQAGERRIIGTTVELRGVRKSGELFSLELSLSSWQAGDETFFTGIIRDISERKAAETAMRRLHQELEARVAARTEELSRERSLAETVINSLPGLFYLFDQEGHMLRWNRNVEMVTGYTADEIAHMNPLDFIQEKKAAARQIQTVFQTGEATLEGQLITKAGRLIPYLFTGLHFTAEDHPSLIGVGIDITERKRAEERLAFLAEASVILAGSLDFEETLQTVADLVASRLADWCAVNIVGQDGAIEQVAVAHVDPEKVDWARSLRQRYPPDPEAPFGTFQVIRTGQSEFYPAISDDLLEAAAHDEEHLALLRQVGFRSAMIVPMQAHEKTLGTITFVCSDSGRYFTESDLHLAEELAHRAALVIDNARLYREAQQLYQEAEEARWEAEEMSRLKSAFLANMSHEIRTPLTGLIGFASLLGERVPEAERALAYRIEVGGMRLLETLNAVLALAQLEANQAALDLEPLAVVDEVRQTLEQVEGQIRQKGLTFAFRVEPGTEEARARLDRGALSSILQNLIGNAIKYTPEGHIMVTIEQDHEHVYLHVKDTGVGIEEDFLPRLFEPFQQESRGWSRTYEGAGLGLSITKRLVEHMNGRITAESEKGRGSRFTVRFPRAAPPDEAGRSTSGQPDGTAQHGTEPTTAQILVVEDNNDTQLVMRLLLEKLGSVTVASNAEEALAEVRGKRGGRKETPAETEGASEQTVPPGAFDVIFMDINLGSGKNGTDVFRELRTLPAYQQVPVAAVTAYALPGDRERLLKLGFDAYLSKPFSGNDLLDLARRLLH